MYIEELILILIIYIDDVLIGETLQSAWHGTYSRSIDHDHPIPKSRHVAQALDLSPLSLTIRAVMVLLLCPSAYISVPCDLSMHAMGVGGDGALVAGLSAWMWATLP
uniref:Uncharacterized protein n=1 Tax=Physcomitrium patens TaxID=3218 RepID=A0A2K1IMU9_PHYPA|nr:hypothetical protein PHYPA_026913 [Physcomitrium patens]